jgi:hypothetical protein
MKFAAFAASLMIAGLPAGFAAAQQQPTLTGADLFVDLDRYIGKEVILTGGEVFDADNDGAFLRSGGATFRIIAENIDRETFRVFLKSCASIVPADPCKRRFLVTPNGQKLMNWPILTAVRIAP